jgi:hypothetical protein
MARGALAAIGADGELPLVRVRLMAVRAFGMSHRLLKIAGPVTLHAADAGVLPG